MARVKKILAPTYTELIVPTYKALLALGGSGTNSEIYTEVAVGEWIETVEYDYPGFHLSMDCFWCEIVKGDLVLKEHEAARWLTREELTDVEWLPADVAVAEKIEEEMD